jgi:hypothetical protein
MNKTKSSGYLTLLVLPNIWDICKDPVCVIDSILRDVYLYFNRLGNKIEEPKKAFKSLYCSCKKISN